LREGGKEGGREGVRERDRRGETEKVKERNCCEKL